MRRDGDELSPHRLGPVGALQQPIAGRGGVGQGLQGAEGLGDHDEQGGFRVRAGQGVGDGVAVDVGNEAEGQRAVGGSQRLGDKLRAELGAPNADVDDPPKRPPGMPGALAVANRLGKRHEPLPGRRNRLGGGFGLFGGGCPQGRVQSGGALGAVDRLTCEQRFAPRLPAAFLGQFQQRFQNLKIDRLPG